MQAWHAGQFLHNNDLLPYQFPMSALSSNFLTFYSSYLVHHAGDLIALGSKSGSKASLRHPPSADSDDSSKPSKQSGSLGTGGNPAKKFKASGSGENSGGLFSDPIRVSQVSQPGATSSKQQSSSSKSTHSASPQPSAVGTTQHIIEGMCLREV